MGTVRILHWRRCDDFRQIFLEGEDLRPCRKALETVGFSMDLSDCRLGPAKLVVRPELAWPAIQALGERMKRTKKHLHSRMVVVCATWEQPVRELVKRSCKGRINC